MDRLDDYPAPAPTSSAEPPPDAPFDTGRIYVNAMPKNPPYRVTRGDVARVTLLAFWAACAAGMHAEFTARSGLSQGAVWFALAVVVIATGIAMGRILAGRCVGIVPTLIICSTIGITLATIAYGIGEHVARWIT